MKVPKSHPRYTSLKIRERIVKGVELGITSLAGLTAHGRGEAFDYLLGEKTHPFGKDAIEAAAAMLILAKHPVISVNGNTAALVAKELVALSKLLNAPLEVNLFHTSKTRERKINDYLRNNGATNVLLPERKVTIKYLASNRKYVNKNGIAIADVVFVPLEDGDRTEALIKNGKKVITVDLNPLSRTAKHATITIVDNIIRALPQLITTVKRLQKGEWEKLEDILKTYRNKKVLVEALQQIALAYRR